MSVLLLAIHILICGVIGYKLYTKQVKVRTPIYIVVVCVPVVGACIFYAELLLNKKGRRGIYDLAIEKQNVTDVKYKNIHVENEDNTGMVVPLEEAIAVNDAKTRRKLLLNILHKNPEEHIELLQRARLSDDTELTHYATTTMMEIQSGYEQGIRELEKRVQQIENLQDQSGLDKVLRKLRKELESYIESGLITGNILNIYRKKLGNVLDKLLLLDPNNKTYHLSKLENKVAQAEFVGVEEALCALLQKWPEDEQIYKSFINYYAATNQGQKIQQVLKEIDEKEVYITSGGKKWFAFWKRGERHE
ncbi:MAG: hypothetical protein IKW08_05070 [Roseburia sp.]|nr:hypothetical protein [Roseburia sp.]